MTSRVLTKFAYSDVSWTSVLLLEYTKKGFMCNMEVFYRHFLLHSNFACSKFTHFVFGIGRYILYTTIFV